MILDANKTKTQLIKELQALRTRESGLRNILSTMDDFVFILDKSDRFVSFFAPEDQQHLNPFEFLGKKHSNIMPPEIDDKFQKALANIKAGESGEYEYHIEMPDGDHWFSVKLSPMIEGSENVGTIAVSRDITKRKLAEETLKDSEENFRYVIENLGEGIGIVNTEERFTFTNSMAEKIFGVSEGGLMGKTLSEFVDKKTGDFFKGQTQLRKLGETSRYNISFIRRDGERRYMTVTATPQLDKCGKFIGTLGIFRDTTEWKKAEKSLLESEERYCNMVEGLFAGIIILVGSKIVFANKAIQSMIGVTEKGEFIDKDLLEFVPFDDHEKIMSTIKATYSDIQSKEDAEPVVIEQIIMNKAGDKLIIEASPILINYYGENAIMVVVNDITSRRNAERERHNLEAQVRQSQKLEAMGTMVGGIAHDFNNILQSTFLYGEVVKEQLPDDEKLRSDFQHLLDDGERARKLVQQILTFSRRGEIELKPQTIHEIILDALSFERASLPANIQIEHNINTHCSKILCDSTHIHQIILNLCNNAKHAMSKTGGTLSVMLDQRKALIGDIETEVVVLIVSDTGHGMDDATMKKLFDPFFTTKPAGEGTGLGLSIIYGIVELMQGQINVSSNLDVGTSFQVLIPLAENVHAVIENQESIPMGEENFRVLLVDDEESIRVAGKVMLNRQGHQVDTAADGAAALELFKLKTNAYDVIVTDLAMPNLSGMDLIERIREFNTDVPIILSSGSLGLTEKQDYRGKGVSAFLPKPWTHTELIQKIAGVIH